MLPKRKYISTFSSLFALSLWIFTGCSPKILSFDPDRHSTGQDNPVTLKWSTRGDAHLLIHDTKLSESGPDKLSEVTLITTYKGSGSRYLLRAADTLRLAVDREDSMIVQKVPDNSSEDRLRYFTLVATSHGKDAIKTIQVEVRMDSAIDEIGFTPKMVGDSLVAAGPNNSVRWGNDFVILDISADEALYITHSNITRFLAAGKPDSSFRGTPVQGDWSFSRLMTVGEKNGTQRLPRVFTIDITIKHR